MHIIEQQNRGTIRHLELSEILTSEVDFFEVSTQRTAIDVRKSMERKNVSNWRCPQLLFVSMPPKRQEKVSYISKSNKKTKVKKEICAWCHWGTDSLWWYQWKAINNQNVHLIGESVCTTNHLIKNFAFFCLSSSKSLVQLANVMHFIVPPNFWWISPVKRQKFRIELEICNNRAEQKTVSCVIAFFITFFLSSCSYTNIAATFAVSYSLGNRHYTALIKLDGDCSKKAGE